MNLQKYMDIHIFVAFCFLFVAWRVGDLKKWRVYYPTILFMICGDMLHGFMLSRYPLWKVESPLLTSVLCTVFIAVLSYPATVTMYLEHFPVRWLLRAAYIVFWSFLFLTIEYAEYRLGRITYYHGWSIWFSLLFNFVMFPLLWLHERKPLLADAGLLACALGGLLLFQVPLEALG